MKASRKAAEDDLELINRETQRKLKELDVVVPLRLHQVYSPKLWRLTGDKTGVLTLSSHAITPSVNQIQFDIKSDLSQALVMDVTELNRLQERIKQLHVEMSQQRDLHGERRKHRARLLRERRDMEANVQGELPTGHRLGLDLV